MESENFAKIKETVFQAREFELSTGVDPRAVPIFILGIMPRSGTHFLANLLCIHPDCTKSAIPEDGLITRVGLLDQYVNALHRQWFEQVDKVNPKLRDLLLENLGEGLITFLQRARDRVVENNADRFPQQARPQITQCRIVSKTPDVRGLRQFFRLLPRAQLLILVRDGRAVVESCARSFHRDNESNIREWALSAREIIEFDRNPSNAARSYLIVRYEDLVTDIDSEMRRVLSFLRLDLNRYDFQAARNVPVVGSSTFKRGHGPVHWLPVRKTDDFKPLARADHWTQSQHERFNWLAADYLNAFGYQPKSYSNIRAVWMLWNWAMDVKWSTRVLLRRGKNLLYSLTRKLKTAVS